MTVADRIEVTITHQAAEVAEEVDEEACLSRPGGQVSKIRIIHQREEESAVEKMHRQENLLVEAVVACKYVHKAEDVRHKEYSEVLSDT